MIDWQDLLHFAAFSRNGSLSAAARELGVDHATVARRIASLERALDLRLIDRLPRSAPLTADGKAIATLVAEMEVSVHTIQRHARATGAAPTATVRVSAPPAIAARLIAPNAADLHRAHPEITLVLSGVPGPAALDRGEADIAVRLSRPQEGGLITRRIGVMRFGLYASPALAAKPPHTWSFVGYDASLDHVSQQAWLRSLLDGRAIVFQASDLFGLQEAARAGLGAAALPAFMGADDPGLVRLPVETPPPVRDLWLIVYPDLRRSPSIRTVMKFLIDVIGRQCPVTDAALGQD